MLLHPEFNDVKHLFNYHGLPERIDDLHLERIWYERLERLINRGPILQINGAIIEEIIDHYGRESSASQDLGAELADKDRTQILEKWRALNKLYETRREQTERQAYEVWTKVRNKLRAIAAFSGSPSTQTRFNFIDLV
ncbi:hypothetical protein FRC07_002310 [Ceratobasidium sp. 392]|nr:hypothetical protein FRC07_002310 [Ceratobasidium sp. 392]